MAFGIDNEGHNFSRATRGYTLHKICLHSWETRPLNSAEVPRGLRYGALRGRRDTGAAIDLGILLAGRGETESSRIHLPSGFTRVAPVFYRYASWIYSAYIENVRRVVASISKDVRFYYNQPSSHSLKKDRKSVV